MKNYLLQALREQQKSLLLLLFAVMANIGLSFAHIIDNVIVDELYYELKNIWYGNAV